ncbi:hypothetical protein PQR65_00755 [Paraburkholderia nemoris]|uniref:hypothetical protein n=1 Tax=Paraburkholderia nemoris TaxID=2793076 RepID=UPI0038B6D7A1
MTAANVKLPIRLTDDDWRWLEGVLPDLPPLCHPISDEAHSAFLTAYRNLKERRTWEPYLLTKDDVGRRKLKQDDLFMDHRNALERMFETGKLSLFDRRHTPASGFSVRGLISRSAAIAYLERHGFEHRDSETDAGQDEVESEKIQVLPGQSNAKWRPGQRKISLEKEQEVFDYCMSVTGKVRGPVKATAEKFGVSEKTIYLLVKKVEGRRKNERLDQLLVNPDIGNTDLLPT